jgi:hypothetical protein
MTKKKKHNHQSTHHFQDQWVTKLPWEKSIVDEIGNVHQVWCAICMNVKGKGKLFVLKIIVYLSTLIGTKPRSQS